MSTRLLKPVTLTKDGQYWRLRDPVHVAAFLAKGWKMAAEPVAEEPAAKPVRKARAKE